MCETEYQPLGAAALPVLQARRVILRLPVPADAAARVEVPDDPEAHRMYGGSTRPGGPSESKEYTEAEAQARLTAYSRQDLSQVRSFVIAALVWPDGRPVNEPDGRYIGGARLHNIVWEDRRARLAIGIFDRRFWSRGYGTEAIRLLLRYGFDELRLHRIDLRVLDYNTRAIRAYEKCGFVREGVERDSAFVNGQWHSDVVMGILEHEYRAQPWAGGQ